MTTFLIVLAFALGLIGLPMGLFGWILFPCSAISLFNEFAAPRSVLISILAITIACSVFPLSQVFGRIWQWLDPGESNYRDARTLGAQAASSLAVVVLLVRDGWINTDQSTWLLTSYWFVCMAQLWNAGFYLLGQFVLRRGQRRYAALRSAYKVRMPMDRLIRHR